MLNKRNNVLYLIVLFALALRLYGINFEVPHPDDYITVQAAMHFGVAQVKLSGYGLYGLYNWPAFPMIYLLIILFTLYFCLGWLVGIFPDIGSFANLYFTDPSSFYLIGRIMCVGFGAGTVWTLYYLARKLYNHQVGLLAALFLSVSFIHSFHSQFIRPDVPTTFFAVITLLFCLMILEKGKLRDYIYAGIFTGLSTATKFTSGVLIVPILIAHLMNKGRKVFSNGLPKKKLLSAVFIFCGLVLLLACLSISMINYSDFIAKHFSPDGKINNETISFIEFLLKAGAVLGVVTSVIGVLATFSQTANNFIRNLLTHKPLLAAGAVTVISFLASYPLFLLHYKEQLRAFMTDPNFTGNRGLFVGVDSLGFWGNLWWYIKGSLNWGLGLHFEILAALGLLIALYRKKREDLIIIVFFATYFLVIGFGNLKWERYVIVLMPFVSLYAASALFDIIKKMSRHNKTFMTKSNAVLICAAGVMIISPLYNILRYNYLLTTKDTRVSAKEWVERNIPPGSKIGQDEYTGDLSEELFQITKKFSLGNEPLSYYIDHDYQYLIVSDTQYRRYLAEPEKHPENVDFYKRLFSEGKLIKEFIPRSDLWPTPPERFPKYHIHISPTIRVYCVRQRPRLVNDS